MSAQPMPRRSETAAEFPAQDRQPARLAIREATATDVAPLNFFFDTVLRNDYFLKRGQLQDMINSRNHRVFVAEIDFILVGVAILTGQTRLVNALVHPAYRGLRIGRALIETSGAKQVRAKIDMSTGDPRPFYHALGFQPTGQHNHKGNIELMQRTTPLRTCGPGRQPVK